jgi:hypothetical protein
MWPFELFQRETFEFFRGIFFRVFKRNSISIVDAHAQFAPSVDGLARQRSDYRTDGWTAPIQNTARFGKQLLVVVYSYLLCSLFIE